MRLLIVGTLKGQLTTATKLAMSRRDKAVHFFHYFDDKIKILRIGR